MWDECVQSNLKQFNQMSGEAASYSFWRLAVQTLQKRTCNSIKGRRSEASFQPHQLKPSPVTNRHSQQSVTSSSSLHGVWRTNRAHKTPETSPSLFSLSLFALFWMLRGSWDASTIDFWCCRQSEIMRPQIYTRRQENLKPFSYTMHNDTR
jgi:hypothetical protein